MHPSHTCAWLAWFEATSVASCRAYLYKDGGLDSMDADTVINTARWQVYRHWATIENPLPYFWQTLRRAARTYRRRRMREQYQQEAYTTWWHGHTQQTAHTTQQVGNLLEEATRDQRQLLRWFALGYDDAQVAVWLKTTPTAIRVRRYKAYRALRASVAASSPPY